MGRDGRSLGASAGVFALATLVYLLLYGDDSLWSVARRHLGFVAVILWIAMVPTFFGFAVHKGLGLRWGASLWAVVAAPAAAHGVILLWQASQPFAVRIADPAIFYTMLTAQVFFVHLGATLAEHESRRRGRRLGGR